MNRGVARLLRGLVGVSLPRHLKRTVFAVFWNCALFGMGNGQVERDMGAQTPRQRPGEKVRRCGMQDGRRTLLGALLRPLQAVMAIRSVI